MFRPVTRVLVAATLLLLAGFGRPLDAASPRATYTEIFRTDFENDIPRELIRNRAAITTDPQQILNGRASVVLDGASSLVTDPSQLALSPRTYYIVELSYRILDRGTDHAVLGVHFEASHSNDSRLFVTPNLLPKHAEAVGRFSTGTMLADAPGYVMRVQTYGRAIVVVDDLSILRIDPRQGSGARPSWAALASAHYPRLGNMQNGSTAYLAVQSPHEPTQYARTPQQIEERLAFADVMVATSLETQTRDASYVRRLQQRNANLVVLFYRGTAEQAPQPFLENATINYDHQYFIEIPDEWIVKKADGQHVAGIEFPETRIMNLSEWAPTVRGFTFNRYLVDSLVNTNFATGMWDGVFFDNMIDRLHWDVPNRLDSSKLDFDLNRNGRRDETAAMGSEITRAGVTQMLELLRGVVGDDVLVVGNGGPVLNQAYSRLVNGRTFECVNQGWTDRSQRFSEAMWRLIVETYFRLQAETRSPHVTILEGCGRHDGGVATAADIHAARMVIGTTLLSDGYGEYDLFDGTSLPYWFDEYTVNGQGVAVEDAAFKGYLGAALGPATELASQVTRRWTETFDGSLPSTLTTNEPGNVYITRESGEILDGSGSLVLRRASNTPTNAESVTLSSPQMPLAADTTYLVEFDWKVLDTLENQLEVNIQNGGTGPYAVHGVVAGDQGHAVFPVTLEAGSNYRLQFRLLGTGTVALDNLQVSEGGAGPWRRDFEHGVVLVNPLNRPQTLSASEVAGPLNRGGLSRLRGTQDRAVNSGEPVNGPITLPAADALILVVKQVAQTPH